ncbi:MAG: phospho-sugar mutase [Clostridia bacterium]|nr:phospho-sugar mutase [Clostridia bacterium]
MDAMQAYKRWLQLAVEDADVRAELESLDPADEKAVTERFGASLAFGTGGLRGLLGAGSNRMNIYVIRRATQGLANHLKASCERPAVAIAHDSRIKSDLFSREAARVLAANGVTVWLYPRLEPTPALSFAVRYHGCQAGICVTASHNPAAYNGYKAYGADGGQFTDDDANATLACIEKLDYFDDVTLCDYDEAVADGRIRLIPDATLSAYLSAIRALSVADCRKDLRVVYSPLNGAGHECVTHMFALQGVTDVTIVPEQEYPDGTFPTCPYPNPEMPEAMALGLALAKEKSADLLIATDPDCDRVGAAAKDASGAYTLLTGNEVGLLLLDFICNSKQQSGTMSKNPVVVTTIVSSDMTDAIAKAYGAECRRTLTGFKYIGEQIGLLEDAGEVERFLFGFEESCGYLSGPHCRDKDAVNACMLLCEMASYYKTRGESLYTAMQALYARYGYFCNGVESFAFPGLEGKSKMAAFMASLRKNPPKKLAGYAVEEVLDYQHGMTANVTLPPANVLEFRLSGGCKAIARPSGTEPKLKIYVFGQAAKKEDADAQCAALLKAFAALIDA